MTQMQAAFQNMHIVTGWVQTRRDVTGRHYRHADGLQAHEIVVGKRSLGLRVQDEKGQLLGVVNNEQELP